MILLSGSLVLHFASIEHIFLSPVLGICFVFQIIIIIIIIISRHIT